MKSHEISALITTQLEAMHVEFDPANLGEHLDSLNRLELLEFLGEATGKNFDFLIVDVDSWQTLNSLVTEIAYSFEN
jgi:acyl carrier protein